MDNSEQPAVADGAGLLARAARALGLRRAGEGVAAAALPHPALAPHAAKLCSAAEAVGCVRPGDHVFVGSACATPRGLLAALEVREPAPSDVELVHFLTDQALPPAADGQRRTRFRHRAFFVGSDLRDAVQRECVDYVPVSLAAVPRLIEIGRIPVDVAFVQVSLPDAFGYVSLGVSVDIAPAAVARARVVVAEVLPQMPRTRGDSLLHVDAIQHLVWTDTPVIEYRHPAVPVPVAERIARYVSGLIDDGATLQAGAGRIPHEVLALLHEHRDLGIHSDVVTDALLPLLRAGVVNGRRKSHERGRVVASYAMGSRELYALLDDNPLFRFKPIDAVARVDIVAAQQQMVALAQAFSIDLTGQVCMDRLDGQDYGGVAAQAEFLRGAAASPGGKAIVCLAATDGGPGHGQPRIRARLEPGEAAAIARSDLHFVVTEYGVAYLFGKSLRERALALIAIAHPAHREALLAAAREQGLLPADAALPRSYAYAAQDERRLTLKDGSTLLMRPATAADADGIRALFHSLSERDVYTRFFRRIRGLSDRDVQRLCNLDHEREVGFVAVLGDREAPQVVAHACYFVDPSTNLAETAFMVSPALRGRGLASAAQRRMVEHARARGVRGFVADVLATNTEMIRLAHAAGAQVRTESEGSSVRITALFEAEGAAAPPGDDLLDGALGPGAG